MAAGKQAVLEGYEADAVNPPLRFGDGVTFIPNGCNGVAAYAGSVARPLCAVPSAPDTLCCAKRPVACVHAAHARVRTCAPSHLRAHTHARTHARTLACPRTRTRTRTHARACPLARARTRTHAHTDISHECSLVCVAGRMMHEHGWRCSMMGYKSRRICATATGGWSSSPTAAVQRLHAAEPC